MKEEDSRHETFLLVFSNDAHMRDGSLARSPKVTSLGKNLEFDASNLSAEHHDLESSSASCI